MGKLDGKIALITGGTSGIGATCAELFAEEGAFVIITGRNLERGGQEENKINQKYAEKRSQFIACDVSQLHDIKGLFSLIERDYGRLDILINNAGILITKNLEEMEENDIDKIYQTNYKSIVNMTRIFMPLIINSVGTILNMASIAGLQSHIAGRRSYLYSSAKAAVIQFSKICALNYAAQGIRINCICPGIVNTPIYTNRDFSRFNAIPMKRVAEPIEVAKASLFLVSQDASYITGAELTVDGGESLR